MNKVYKVVWSKTKNCYVIASELAKSRVKVLSNCTSRTLACSVLACVFSFGITSFVLAAGNAGNINSGNTSNVSGADVWQYLQQNKLLLGGGASLSGSTYDIIIGTGAKHLNGSGTTTGSGGAAIVIGRNAKVTGANTEIAIGANSEASGAYAGISIGTNAIVKSSGGVAIGAGATTNSYRDQIAIGSNARTTYENAMAIGVNSYAKSNTSLAIGNNSYAGATNAIAIGPDSTSTSGNVISVGHKAGDVYYQTTTKSEELKYTVSYTEKTYDSDLFRRITNVANGSGAHDAATVAQTHTTSVGNGLTLATATNSNGSTKYTITPKAGTNVTVNSNGINVTGGASVSSGNTGLMTGGNAYTELRPSSDGTFIKTASTSAANLTALDTAAKNAIKALSINGNILTYTRGNNDTGTLTLPSGGGANYSAGNNISIENNTVSAVGLIKYDDDTKKVATLEGGSRGTKLTNLSSAELSRTSTDAVIGNQLWTTNQNMSGMKADINTNKGNILSLNESVTNALESITTMSTLIDTIDGVKADASLNNLNNEGKAIIKAAAVDAVQEYMAGNNKVVMNRVIMNEVVPDDTSNATGGEVYSAIEDAKTELQGNIDAKADISYVDDGLALKADKNEVYLKDEINTLLDSKANVDDVYTKFEVDTALSDKADISYVDDELSKKADKMELEDKAEADASNIDVDKWSEKLGVGTVEEGSTGLVNGGAVFDAIKNVGGNNMVKAGTDAVEIGSDAKYDGLDAVSIAKSNGDGRVLKGVVVDQNDDTSAANVGYVKNIAEGLATGINESFGRLDNKINKTGAGAAALANLHPIADDGDTKWNIAAGVGRYHGESAGAVGVFYKPSDRVAMNISSTIGNSDTMFGAGVSVAIDKPVSNGLSKVQLAKRLDSAINVINQQSSEIAQLKKEVAELKRNK